MGWILRTKNDVSNPTLPGGVYGKYITIGRAFYFHYDGSQTHYGIFISDGGRYGMADLDAVEYKGSALDREDWKLHPGTITKQINPLVVSSVDTGTNKITTTSDHGLVEDDPVRIGVVDGNMPTPVVKTAIYTVRSVAAPDTLTIQDGGGEVDITDAGSGTILIWKADTGFDDPDQGMPTFIPEINTTLSGICYIEGILPSGQSDPVDPPTWDDFRIIGTGRKLMDYDNTGAELGVVEDTEVLSNLPMQVVDNFLSNYSGKPSRIDWASWRLFRDDADVLIWQRVVINGDEPPTEASGFTARYYSDEVFGTPVLTQVETTLNHPSNSLSPGPGVPPIHFSGRYTASIKAKYSELTTFKFVHDDTIKFWIEGNLLLDVTMFGTDTCQYTLIADEYYEVTIELTQGTGPWSLVFSWFSASLSEEVVPASNVAPTDTLVKRYENHAAFPIAIEANEVHQRLMERAPGWDWTDDEGLIKFLPPNRPVVFEFTYDRMDDDNRPNFVKQTLNKKRRALADRPNFLLFRFRNALLTGYPFAYVQADREELRLLTNGEPTNNSAEDLGVMTRSLAERVAEMEMILKSDPKYVASVSGTRRTGKIRKNHFVTGRYVDAEDNTVLEDKFIVTFHSWGSPIGQNDFSLLPIPEQFYTDEPEGGVGDDLGDFWSPADLPNALAWWRWYDMHGFEDDEPVDTWVDTINGFEASSALSGFGAQPLYKNAGYITFDGSNDYLLTDLTTSFGDFAVFVVFRAFNITEAATRILDKTYGTGFWLGFDAAGGGNLGAGIRQGSPPYGDFYSASANTWYAMLVQRNGTTKTVRFAGSSHTATVSNTPTSTDAMVIGTDTSLSPVYGQVDIKEILICDDDIAGDDLDNLIQYALDTYGLVL